MERTGPIICNLFLRKSPLQGTLKIFKGGNFMSEIFNKDISCIAKLRSQPV